MQPCIKLFSVALLFANALAALAGVHYVDASGTNPTLPYVTWATAATNIQDAVDSAVAGDEIVVTNGVYAVGSKSVDGFTTNRVTVDKPLSLHSVNGPQFTIIDGGGFEPLRLPDQQHDLVRLHPDQRREIGWSVL